MLANEMNKNSATSRENNKEFNELWKKVKANILEKSNEGKNRVPFSVYGHYDLKEQLMQKLKEEGFKLLYGCQINAGYHSQATLYVVW